MSKRRTAAELAEHYTAKAKLAEIKAKCDACPVLRQVMDLEQDLDNGEYEYMDADEREAGADVRRALTVLAGLMLRWPAVKQ